ncbi:MAG TPA: ECF-type sigma factor [Thermoanaerobaculia bacterium]|nr:ECF-type sigma factor [Thermoanaerobaculia bacterium]
MQEVAAGELTQVLGLWQLGEPAAESRLVEMVYAELHRLAGSALRRERADHTLQPTALVHEAYLRLSSGTMPAYRDRQHFFAVAARLMRRILVDHARAAGAAKRGGRDALRVPLEEAEPVGSGESAFCDVVALDEAIQALARLDGRKARVIELRFFAGLTAGETAELLGVSVPTVILDTRIARAWMFTFLSEGRSAAAS